MFPLQGHRRARPPLSQPFSTAGNHSIEARPSANHKSDYKLTCRFFEFITNGPPYKADCPSAFYGRLPGGRLQLSCLLFRNRRVSSFSLSRGRVKFRLFFNLLPCVEFTRIGPGEVPIASHLPFSPRESLLAIAPLECERALNHQDARTFSHSIQCKRGLLAATTPQDGNHVLRVNYRLCYRAYLPHKRMVLWSVRFLR